MSHKFTKDDPRAAQAVRVADFLEAYPGSSTREIDAACDLGSATKVLSEMPAMGYRLRKSWERVPCADGIHTRRVRCWWLLYRPESINNQRDLFDSK